MWKFDGHDVRTLRGALKRAKQARWFKRLQAVMLVAMGTRPRDAAAITGQSRRSVYNCLRRYTKRRKPDDLMDHSRSGRPKVAGVITAGRIRREYERDPLALGYMATEWTVALLAGHLSRRYCCAIGARTLRRRLKSLDLAWKRPRHAYFSDPHRPQKKGRWSNA